LTGGLHIGRAARGHDQQRACSKTESHVFLTQS
jgi:hypothetical protein